MTIPPDIFGSAEMTFSPTKRLGSNATRLSQLQDGRWKVVSDYMTLKK
jgi:branched-chain amino acid transport system substrate-binding protein